MLYSDPTIQEYIPSKFLVNSNIYHIKVSLVAYAVVEMHESDRMFRQFGYEFLPTCEAIVTPELACYSEYMSWFKVYGKPYLLSEKVRGRQSHMRRPRQTPRNPRRGGHDGAVKTGPLSTPTQQPTPIAAPPPGQYDSTYSSAYTNPVFFT
ncbi:hypothetical protein Gotur_027768 [Gossypium turneri]